MHAAFSFTFVRVVEIHGVECNDGNRVRDDFDRVVRATLEDSVVREGDKVLPYSGDRNNV
jgi:hypothetical protein